MQSYSWPGDLGSERIPAEKTVWLSSHQKPDPSAETATSRQELWCKFDSNRHRSPPPPSSVIYTWMGYYFKSCLHHERLERWKKWPWKPFQTTLAPVWTSLLRENKNRSSINDNEPRARRAKQVEDSSARTRRRMSRSARSVYCLDAQKFLDADLSVWGEFFLSLQWRENTENMDINLPGGSGKWIMCLVSFLPEFHPTTLNLIIFCTVPEEGFALRWSTKVLALSVVGLFFSAYYISIYGCYIARVFVICT